MTISDGGRPFASQASIIALILGVLYRPGLSKPVRPPTAARLRPLTEHSFHDSVLEPLRDDLFSKAAKFVHAEAWNGVQHPRNEARRYCGITQGDAEVDPEKAKLLYEKALAIHVAATDFFTAHTDLVQAAKDRGYNLDALRRDRHPRVRHLDAIYEPQHHRSWSDAPAPAWPGGRGPRPA